MRVRCSGCRKELNAPDTAAGRIVKCPGCGTKLRLPKPTRQPAQPAKRENYGDPSAGSYDDLAAYPSDSRKPCPMCGERIAAKAIKCRYCGEHFGDRPRNGKNPRKRGRRTSSTQSKFRTQAIALGGFWIFCGVMNGVFAPLLLISMEKQNNPVHPIAYVVLIGIGVFFGLIGTFACMRNLIALYAGLIVSYLYIAINMFGMILQLVGVGGTPICVNMFWIAVFVAVVIQAHRVIGWAHRYRY